MTGDYSYEYTWDKKYCYPDSNVLINKLGITDSEILHTAEREITAFKIAKVKDIPIKGHFDLTHLRKIHRYVFCDIYSWSGKLRTVNISKGNQFCICDYLETYADNLFLKLKAENYLISSTDTLHRLAYYLSEINVLHPFREGNGRTQRLFIEYLGTVAGYTVDFSDVSDKEMIIASADSYIKEYDKIYNLFDRITTPLPKKEQVNAIKYFFGKTWAFV